MYDDMIKKYKERYKLPEYPYYGMNDPVNDGFYKVQQIDEKHKNQVHSPYSPKDYIVEKSENCNENPQQIPQTSFFEKTLGAVECEKVRWLFEGDTVMQ